MPANKQNTTETGAKKAERIAKRIAAAGLCSRRDAERWIEEGRVDVNSEVIYSPALNVTEDDIICVDGKPLPKTESTALIFAYHKPKGVMCTTKDPEGRPTVFDMLPPTLPRLVLVGRLDFSTEGLLLLTTDGSLAQTLMHPKTGLKRTYRVRVHGRPQEEQLVKLRRGITVDGVRYKPMDVTLAESKSEGSNNWLNITITEGKNREIRKAMEFVGLQVNRLIRTSYGPFKLRDLPKGAIMQVPYNRVEKLIKEVGLQK